MKSEVAEALAELQLGLPGNAVRHLEDPDGGAYVVIEGLFIGENFRPSISWVGFHITWAGSDADIYPLFIAAGVQYMGPRETPNRYPEGDLPKSISRGAEMLGFKLAAVQISRLSQRRDPETDSALQKMLRVLAFLRSH
jgi:hypothetical protein